MEVGTDNRATASTVPAKAASQTLARGLRLLQAIADGGEGVAVRELGRAAALPRSICSIRSKPKDFWSGIRRRLVIGCRSSYGGLVAPRCAG
jgi:hypothetical protein